MRGLTFERRSFGQPSARSSYQRGSSTTNKIVRSDVAERRDYNLRIPSGNEAGANSDWIPGGLLPDGLPEAVFDGRDIPTDGYSVSDIDDMDGLK